MGILSKKLPLVVQKRRYILIVLNIRKLPEDQHIVLSFDYDFSFGILSLV